MHWSDIESPNESVSRYNHTILETPLGKMIIEWKSWKENPDYDLSIDGEWICCEYSLEETKDMAKTYLLEKLNQLKLFIGKYDFDIN